MGAHQSQRRGDLNRGDSERRSTMSSSMEMPEGGTGEEGDTTRKKGALSISVKPFSMFTRGRAKSKESQGGGAVDMRVVNLA